LRTGRRPPLCRYGLVVPAGHEGDRLRSGTCAAGLLGRRGAARLSLAGDAPEPRGIQGRELGEVVEIPEVGGLHHRCEQARSPT